MDKFVVDNYPHKKPLFLSWYEAAIAHLLLFKHLREKYSNNVYFLISEQGIMMKATTLDLLRSVQDQINRYFSAKIQELEISASADFYEHLSEDIKQQTEKLKDSRDCPYINLVSSNKIKQSALSLKKYGYAKPYECWQCLQRQKRGFCYLIVRPEHRFKQIANNVLGLVKKRQNSHAKGTSQSAWPIDLPYQKFIWFYLKKQFKNYLKSIDLKQKKGQNILTIIIKNDIPELNELQKQIDSLQFKYYQEEPHIEDKLQSKVIIISSLQLEKITQLIYHEFGLTGLVKQLRKKSTDYLVIGAADLSLALNQKLSKSELDCRPDIQKIQENQLITIFKLGRRHTLVSYEGMNFVLVRFERPLPTNILSTLKYKIPFLPRYFYWYEKDQKIFMLRNYFPKNITQAIQTSNLNDQLNFIYSFFICLSHLHQKDIFVGRKINTNIYIDQKRIVFQTGQAGNKSQDLSKCSTLLSEWVKYIKDPIVAANLIQNFIPNSFTQISAYLQNLLGINK